MVYAGDEWSTFPILDLYNTQVMAMSIQAAKDMYDKGLKRIDDFYEKYGDFITPIQKDQDWYNKNIIGRIQDSINDIYARGGDPLRNAQDRAEVALLIRSIPVANVAKLKLSAEIAKEFIKNRAALMSAGKYDPEQDAFLSNGATLDEWDTLNNGIWTRQSPSLYRTLLEYVHPSFKEIEPHMLNKQDVESRGYAYDPNYEYTGVTRGDMERIMGQRIPGIRNEGIFKYYREQAKQDLIRNGINNPTEDQIDRQFIDNAIIADSQVLTPLKREANKFALEKFNADQQIRVNNAREATAFKYDKKRAEENVGGKGKGTQQVPIIFREAAARPGEEVGYNILEDPHYQWMDPIINGARVVKGKNGNYGYNIPASKMHQIYRKDERNIDGTRVSAQWDYGYSMNDATFIPTGLMRMEVDNNVPHYYITGTIVNNGTGKEVQSRNGTELYEMEVTERAYNYGKKQTEAYNPTK